MSVVCPRLQDAGGDAARISWLGEGKLDQVRRDRERVRVRESAREKRR